MTNKSIYFDELRFKSFLEKHLGRGRPGKYVPISRGDLQRRNNAFLITSKFLSVTRFDTQLLHGRALKYRLRMKMHRSTVCRNLIKLQKDKFWKRSKHLYQPQKRPELKNRPISWNLIAEVFDKETALFARLILFFAFENGIDSVTVEGLRKGLKISRGTAFYALRCIKAMDIDHDRLRECTFYAVRAHDYKKTIYSDLDFKRKEFREKAIEAETAIDRREAKGRFLQAKAAGRYSFSSYRNATAPLPLSLNNYNNTKSITYRTQRQANAEDFSAGDDKQFQRLLETALKLDTSAADLNQRRKIMADYTPVTTGEINTPLTDRLHEPPIVLPDWMDQLPESLKTEIIRSKTLKQQKKIFF